MISVLKRKRCVYCLLVILYKHNVFMIFMKRPFFIICSTYLMLPIVPTGCPFSARCAYFELLSQFCTEITCSLNRVWIFLIVWPIYLQNLQGTLFDKFPYSLTYFDCFGLPYLRVARSSYQSSGYFELSIPIQLVIQLISFVLYIKMKHVLHILFMYNFVNSCLDFGCKEIYKINVT